MPLSGQKFLSVVAMALAVTAVAAESADARRGGSFGSRGARTYQAPPPTRTAPALVAPIQRSMTAAAPQARATAPAPGAAAQAPARRGGFLGGMGGGLLGGLVAGGLLGMLLGHGFGGMAGMGNMLLQLALAGLAVFAVMTLLRRRRPAAAAAGQAPDSYFRTAVPPTGGRAFEMAAPAPQPFAADSADIGLLQSDRDAFERLLGEIQDAFGKEDYGRLRERTTPEIMSYLSEELSQNAVQGRRNEVSNTRLLEADVAEAWREGDADYATAAMRYESVDVMRDRQSGRVIEGVEGAPTQTTELWTFVRRGGEGWKLSAIQEA